MQIFDLNILNNAKIIQLLSVQNSKELCNHDFFFLNCISFKILTCVSIHSPNTYPSILYVSVLYMYVSSLYILYCILYTYEPYGLKQM